MCNLHDHRGKLEQSDLMVKSLRVSEEIVGGDPQEEKSLSFDAEGESVMLGDPTLPEILVPLQFLHLQRWMPRIGQKEGKLLSGSLLERRRQPGKVFLESLGPGKDHRPRLLISSSTLEKV